MINGIVQHGKYMYVHGGHASGLHVNMSKPSAGLVRFDGTNLQVYDGSTWMTIPGSSASVGMNSVAESAIDWAMKKMSEEQEFLELAKTSKSVTIALENLNKAKAELKLIAILAREHDEETTS
jgi:hypothetical protein